MADPVCLLCARQFKSQEHLAKHVDSSQLHQANLLKHGASQKQTTTTTAVDSKKRERDKEQPKEEIPVRKPRFSETRRPTDEPREEEKQSLKDVDADNISMSNGFTLEAVQAMNGSAKDARAINGNLDWKCGYCQTVNFARVIVCTACMKPVNERAQYVGDTEKQRKRHENMMRLAKAKGVS